MKKKLCCACIMMALYAGYVGAEQDMIDYIKYIDSHMLTASEADAQDVLQTSTDEIEKGLAYFRIASLNGKDDAKVLEAYEYWAALVSSHTNNTIVLAYTGALDAMYGGAVKINVIKKTRHAKSGVDTLTRAVKLALPTKNNLAISYVYFLRGRTNASLPKFFREFKKETLNNLKNSEKYLGRAKKEDIYADKLIRNLYANIYVAYSQWYNKHQDYDKSVHYLNKALDQVKEHTPDRAMEIRKAIDDIS